MGVKKDKDGKYKVWYQKRHPITRQPVRMARQGIKTHAEAKRIERDLVIAVEDKLRRTVVPTWEALVNSFMKAEHSRQQKTMDNYFLCIKAHTFEIWGSLLCDTITTQQIRALVLSKSDKSPSHQKNILKFIRWTFQHGVDTGLLKYNPVPMMKFKVGEKVKKVLTEEQVRKFLSQAKTIGSPWYPHWAMAVYTGMRNGELYALTWDKVNLESRQLKVDCSWNNKEGFKTTKSGNERIVEIAPPLLDILRKLKLNSSESNFVLPRIDKWDKGEQARELRMFLQGLGLPIIRFHDLRATFATILLSKGIPPIKVMAIAGWSDMKTMMIYTRMAGVDIKGVTDCLNLHDPSEQNAKVLDFRQRQ